MKKLLPILLLLPNLIYAQLVDHASMNMGSGTPVPTLTVLPTTITGVSVAGSFGSSVFYDLTGSLLGTNAVTVTAPTGWELSKDNSSFSGTLTVTPSGGSISSQRIYARLKQANTAGTYNNPITNNCSALSLTAPVTANGTTSASASLSATPSSITGLNGTAGTPGTAQTVTVTYAGTTVSAAFPTNTQISQDGGGTYTSSSPQTITGTSPAAIKLQTTAAAAAGAISGSLALSGAGVTTVTIPVSGTVSSSGLPNDTINVQFWDSSRTLGKFVDADWNAVAFTNGLHGTVHSSQNLFTTAGTSTAVTVSISNVNDFANNGTPYAASNTTGYPAGAFQEVMFNTISPSSLSFNNVPSGSSYRIEVISSSKTSGTYPNTFTVGSVTDNIDAFNNLSHAIVLDNVTPVSGTITVVNTFTGTFGVINAMRLIIRH